MSSSIITSVPAGLIRGDWCIQNLQDFQHQPNECAKAAEDQESSDFDTICCAGDIIDTTQDLWDYRTRNQTEVDLANLVCCLYANAPLNSGSRNTSAPNTCSQGSPTPLASLAATNTENAALYQRTYTSAGTYSWISSTGYYGDYVPTATPECMWVYTKTGVEMSEVTVPAATVSTMSLLSTPSPSSSSWRNSSRSATAAPSMTSDSTSYAYETITTTSGTLTLTLPASLGGHGGPDETNAPASTTSSAAGVLVQPTAMPVLALAAVAMGLIKGF